jgi:hypothetical protein
MKRWLRVMGNFTRKKIIKSFIFLFLLSILLLFWLQQQCWLDRAEYQSGGLGLSRQQWESLKKNYEGHDSAEYRYSDSKFVYYVTYDNCHIARFRVFPLKENELSSQEIKNQALSLIPLDFECVWCNTDMPSSVGMSPVGSDNDLYFSESLIERFPYKNQRSAGTFIIEYSTNKVSEGFGIWALY